MLVPSMALIRTTEAYSRPLLKSETKTTLVAAEDQGVAFITKDHVADRVTCRLSYLFSLL